MLSDCALRGPVLTERFVKETLLPALQRAGLLPPAEDPAERRHFEGLRELLRQLFRRPGNEVRVRIHALNPLARALGYDWIRDAPRVRTEEGHVAGGQLLLTADESHCLRAFATASGVDLDAGPGPETNPAESPVSRFARLLALHDEPLGLLTNGHEIRLLLLAPSGESDALSQLIIPIAPAWVRARGVPQSYHLLRAVASPQGIRALLHIVRRGPQAIPPELPPRLHAAARAAIEGFLTEVLRHPDNRPRAAALVANLEALYSEALVLCCRLILLLRLERRIGPGAPRFPASPAFQTRLSPSGALLPQAREILALPSAQGDVLEAPLRQLLSGLLPRVSPGEDPLLTGSLFRQEAVQTIWPLRWGDRAAAVLVRGLAGLPDADRPVPYEAMELADLDRILAPLPALQPGYAAKEMCRLRRGDLEAVMPLWQGERHRRIEGGGRASEDGVTWLGEVPAESVYLAPRTGAAAAGQGLAMTQGQVTSGAGSTPAPLARLLVEQVLGPLVDARSPDDDPDPGKILALRVLDPAMGTGHLLAESCRYLGARLLRACQACADAARAPAAGQDPRAQLLRERLTALPDPGGALLRLLLRPEGTGLAPQEIAARAQVLCQRLVAVHCLHGVDLEPRCLPMAQLLLHTVTWVEGQGLLFLDHRLLCGDALTGALVAQVLGDALMPGRADLALRQQLQADLEGRLHWALTHLQRLTHLSVEHPGDQAGMQSHAALLARALLPHRVLAAAWAGQVLLGRQPVHRVAFQRMCASLLQNDRVPAIQPVETVNLQMISRGLGLPRPVDRRGDAEAMLLGGAGGQLEPGGQALPLELCFPDVFFPFCQVNDRRGFDAVLCNPPWRELVPGEAEFLAAHEFAHLGSVGERKGAAGRYVLRQREVMQADRQRKEALCALNRVLATSYQAQCTPERMNPWPEGYRMFLERATQLLAPGGAMGMIVPAAFHRAEAAAPLRWLLLSGAARTGMAPRACYSFRNGEGRFFDLPASACFDVVVAERRPLDVPSAERPLRCAFGLQDVAALQDRPGSVIEVPLDLMRDMGGEQMMLPELTSPRDLEVMRVCAAGGERFARVTERLRLSFGDDGVLRVGTLRPLPVERMLPMGADGRDPEIRKALLGKGLVPLFTGQELAPYDERGGPPPAALMNAGQFHVRAWRSAATFYRLALHLRRGDGQVLVPAVVPGPCGFGGSVLAEQVPAVRPAAHALLMLALCGSTVTDFIVRRLGCAPGDLQALRQVPLARCPLIGATAAFLIHGALRLSANHAGFAALWNEQLGHKWREASGLFAWPALRGSERIAVKAAMDALIAESYGLSREQYAYVLSASPIGAEEGDLALQRFDELKRVGQTAYLRRHDPYLEVPVVAELAAPDAELAEVPPLPRGLTRPLDLPPPAAPPSSGEAPPAHGDLRAAYQRIRDLLVMRGVVRVQEVRAVLPWPVWRVRAVLQALVQARLLIAEGETRARRYKLPVAVPRETPEELGV